MGSILIIPSLPAHRSHYLHIIFVERIAFAIRSYLPPREQCWWVELLDSTRAANCAGENGENDEMVMVKMVRWWKWRETVQMRFGERIWVHRISLGPRLSSRQSLAFSVQVKLEDVFPMVASHHMGSPFSHSAHIYQSRWVHNFIALKIKLDSSKDWLVFKCWFPFPSWLSTSHQAKLHPRLPHNLRLHPASTSAERRDDGNS